MIYYEETYGKYYDEKNITEDQLTEMIREGKIAEPEECVGSRAIKLYGPATGYQYQIMSNHVDNMSSHEKMFYLWELIRWFKEKLDTEMPIERDTKEQLYAAFEIDRLRNSAIEMEQLLCCELF